jgi:hypothetical protein
MKCLFVLLQTIGLACAFYCNVGSNYGAHKVVRMALKSLEYGVPSLLSLFADIFSTNSRTASPTSVLEVQSKHYDQHGASIKIHPLDYDPVDLDAEVATAIADVNDVVSLPPQSEHKGLIHIIRGTGSGKSFALSVVRNALANSGDILPLLITFGPPGSTDDFQSLAILFPHRPDVGLALAIVSRMAGTYYGTGRTDVASRFYAYESALTKLVDGGASGRDIIASFVIHLAQHANMKKVVLMVDGYDQCSWALRACYSQHGIAAEAVAHYLSDAMLSFEYNRFGVSCALVVSGTTPAVTGMRNGRRVWALRLRDHLDPSAVVAKQFLVDIDVADRSRHLIAPELALSNCSPTLVGLRTLELMAALFCSPPRGLECVHDQLRRLVDRTTTPRRLVLTPEKINTVFSNAMARFRWDYRRVHSAYILPDRMYALLFGVPVPLDGGITGGISLSLWINSLCPMNGALNDASNSTDVTLRSSLVLLYATFPPEKWLGEGAVQYHIRQLYETMTSWPALLTDADAHKLDTVLTDSAVSWLCLKLTAAARAEKPFVTVKELLHVNCSEIKVGAAVEGYLAEHIPLPPCCSFGPLHRMQTTLHAAAGHPRKAAVRELDAIYLQTEFPCTVLQAAPQDTWDYGLLFLGRKNDDGTRPRRLLLFDNGARWGHQPERSDAVCDHLAGDLQLGVPLERAGLDQQECREKQRDRQSRYFIKSAQLPQGGSPGGAGQCLARGDYLYVRHTTEDTDTSAAVGNVISLCERDTSGYFHLIYAPYKALKALVLAVTAPGTLSCTNS